MSSLERRLDRLEAGVGAKREAPWWGLSPSKEPDWPRPLVDRSDEELEEISHGDIEEYCKALNEGREYRPSYEEVWLNQEVFHESRWRKHGIARRSSGIPPPKGWDA